jgi:putative ABC transport system permease protein
MVERILTYLAGFVSDLKAQKLRTFLTIFGIVWGTVAIVVLLAFGKGFERQLGINMHGIGEGIAIMFPGQTTRVFQGFGAGRSIRLMEDDAHLLLSQVAEIEQLSPEYSMHDMRIRVGQNAMNTLVAGVYPVYAEMRNIIPEPGGRFIDNLDMRDRKRVALIGDEVKRLLFEEEDAIGKVLYVGDIPFTVVGVMQPKIQNSSYNRRDQDRVFIPSSTFSSVFGDPYLSNIIYTTVDPRRAEAVQERIREVLGKRHKFDPADKDAIWIWDTTEFDKFLFYFFLAFNLFMGIVGAFTLAVGGIGVANIMYIVVQERTKEIGIRRAVGASRWTIMVQFFAETFLILGIGAAIGFVIAVGLARALRFIPISDFVGTPEISGTVVLATMAVLGAIGFAAGLLPARRAANLNVVDCLRT